MRILLIAGALGLLTACEATDNVATIAAFGQTEPVKSSDDAADDPAIWVHPSDPIKSLILGTDKQAGLYVYDLNGQVTQFLETGEVNNVDLRQGFQIGDWIGDLAVASNRTNDTIALYQIDSAGVVSDLGAIPSVETEPYGICMGTLQNTPMIAVAHKTGNAIFYALSSPTTVAKTITVKFETQLEGCVFDETTDRVYIGEEEAGIWVVTYDDGEFTKPEMVDAVDGPSGIAGDVEGLAIYRTESDAYLVASSQGNNSYALYTLPDHRFAGRFRIGAGVVDGTEETDGLDVTSKALGPAFPEGILVVQDGIRPGGAFQNFKIVDWRAVKKAVLQ